MFLWKYSDIFGRAGEGVHRWRIGPFAVIDLLFTAFAVPLLFDHWLIGVVVLFAIAQIVHFLFGVQTPIMKALDLVPDSDREKEMWSQRARIRAKLFALLLVMKTQSKLNAIYGRITGKKM